MADYKSIHSASDKIFENALNKIKDQFEVIKRDPAVGLKLLNQFDELKAYKSLYVHNVTELKVDEQSFIILLVEKRLTVTEQRRTGRREKEIEEVEPVLFFTVSYDMGRVLIKKENIGDKIADIFNKVDIDFKEYPNFSKNYFVIGEKPDLVRKYLPDELKALLNKIENVTIEINGDWGLLRMGKKLSENLLLLLISMGFNMIR